MTRIAVTGGTGFVGTHLIELARKRGLEIAALARRPRAPLAGVDWTMGALDDPEGLAQLVAGAGAVIHIAGVINAPERAGFIAGNVDGTAAITQAAAAAGIGRFIHVSSLAAREPGLSDYGWSKLQSEAIVRASGLDWTIVRPPAIYGPHDREMLELFRMAQRGIVALPPAGRLSVIEAGDLSRLLLDLLDAPAAIGATYEPDDGVDRGWAHRDFAHALGAAVGRRIIALPVPAALLRLGARADTAFRGSGAKLTADRVRYFCHPDWVVGARPPASIWRPAIDTSAGLRATADWYRMEGLL